MKFEGKKILIFQQRGWGVRIGHFLAKKLQTEGAVLAALVFKNSAYKFHMEQTEVKYQMIVSHDKIIEDPRSYLGAEDRTLAEICDDLGVDSIWPFVQSLRHHVRSYADKYYYGYKQEVPDEEIVAYVKACHKLVKRVFAEFRPDLILAPNIATLLHIFFNLYGKKQGVPMIRVIESRIRGVGILTEGLNIDGGRFFDHFQKLQAGEKSASMDKAKEYLEQTARNLITPLHSDRKRKTWIKKIRENLAPWQQAAKYYFTEDPNRLKRFKATIDSRSPKYILRDYFTHKKNLRFAKKYPYADLSKIDKYIYFALQFNPEETIDAIAPRFNNQLETARQVAMSAPGDYTVVVKDHPKMIGRTSPSYIEKLARTPNVKLISPWISAQEAMRRADLVVSISGTTLAEAAFMRKPAIQLGNLGLTRLFPNVFPHSDFMTLTARMKEAMKADLHTKEYERTLLNYIAAAYDTGSDADFVGIWTAQTTDKMEDLWRTHLAEIEYIFKGK